MGRVVAACSALLSFEFMDYDSVIWCLIMVYQMRSLTVLSAIGLSASETDEGKGMAS
jgi:hypothetical protein